MSSSQLLGVLEPHFLDLQISGDTIEIRAIGWQKQIFHHLKLQRTGCGRKFDENSELTNSRLLKSIKNGPVFFSFWL